MSYPKAHSFLQQDFPRNDCHHSVTFHVHMLRVYNTFVRSSANRPLAASGTLILPAIDFAVICNWIRRVLFIHLASSCLGNLINEFLAVGDEPSPTPIFAGTAGLPTAGAYFLSSTSTYSASITPSSFFCSPTGVPSACASGAPGAPACPEFTL